MFQNKKLQKTAKFWDDTHCPVAVAHRGGDAAGINKENSLIAFQASYDLGFRWFETDVVPTRDGKLLAIHGRGYQLHPNKDLPSRLRLQRMSYEEVMKMVRIGGEKPVLFAELLDKFSDVRFFVDPKTIKAAPQLAKFLAKRPQDISRVCVGSFIPFNNLRFSRSLQKITDEKACLSILGPLRSMPIKLAAALPILKLLTRFYVKRTGVQSLHVPYKWVEGEKGEKIAKLSHDFGLKLGVYTVNELNDMRVLLSSGADIIISDNVRVLKRIIE